MGLVATILLPAAGVAAGPIVAVRVQLAVLARWPEAGWPALAAGLLAAGLTLAVTVAVALRLRSPRLGLLLLTGLPVLWLAAGSLSVLHLPRTAFKDEGLRAEWDRLHPTLRLALWVARLGAGDLVLTDVSREAADYAAMGLAAPAVSRHFVTAGDGFARAVDLRVQDAGEVRNWARQGVFLVLGLHADRHGGTADHLHVSLPAPG